MASKKSKTSTRSKASGRSVARKKTATRKKKATRSKAADLRKRAAQAESQVEVPPEPAQANGVNALAMSLGGLDLQNLDLNNVDLDQLGETVQNVIGFVEENPVTSAAVALGAGVVLTSMYWDKITGKPGSN